MESNAIYTTSDAGLSRFFRKDLWPCRYGSGTFSSHFLSDALSLSHVFVNILMNYSWVYMAALF